MYKKIISLNDGKGFGLSEILAGYGSRSKKHPAVYVYDAKLKDELLAALDPLKKQHYRIIIDEYDGSILVIKGAECFILHTSEEVKVRHSFIRESTKDIDYYIWFRKTVALDGSRNHLFISVFAKNAEEILSNQAFFSPDGENPLLYQTGVVQRNYFSFTKEFSMHFSRKTDNEPRIVLDIEVKPDFYERLITQADCQLFGGSIESLADVDRRLRSAMGVQIKGEGYRSRKEKSPTFGYDSHFSSRLALLAFNLGIIKIEKGKP